MKTCLILVLLFVGSGVAFGQATPAQTVRAGDYPEYGAVADIKALRKIFVHADDSDSRAMIIKMLGAYQGLEVVNSPREAEMVLEYQILTRDVAANRGPYARGASMALKSQMQVVTFQPDGTKVIAWTETETLDVRNAFTFSAPNEMNLTHHFVRDLQKVRGEKTSSIRDLAKGPRKEKKKDDDWTKMSDQKKN